MEELLVPDEVTAPMLELVAKRRAYLTEYARLSYWLDVAKLNEIHRYETEGFEQLSSYLHDIARSYTN